MGSVRNYWNCLGHSRLRLSSILNFVSSLIFIPQKRNIASNQKSITTSSIHHTFIITDPFQGGKENDNHSLIFSEGILFNLGKIARSRRFRA
jgi:hypothetical protein